MKIKECYRLFKFSVFTLQRDPERAYRMIISSGCCSGNPEG
jgi:hypothetical protein